MALPVLPNGYSFTFKTEPDDSGMGYPWSEHDGHGVIECRRYPGKSPGEVLLYQDRGEYWFYNVQSTVKLATRDGWGLDPLGLEKLISKLRRTPSKREVTAESVRLDMEYCRKWLNGHIWWVGCVVCLFDDKGRKIATDSCWGFESNDESSLLEFAESAAWGLAESQGLDLESRRKAWRAALRETRERKYWQSRDMVTV